MRIVCISDTHGMHRKLSIPEGDVLVHAGDYSYLGSMSEIADLNAWFASLPHKHKIVISGNHDKYAFTHGPDETKKLFTEAIYLEDESVEIDGITFYGSPWIIKVAYWYFMLPRGSNEIKEKWAKIPTDTDVLVTHMPPAYICDRIPVRDVYLGCEDLRNEVMNRINPKLHIFGHIHEGHGGVVHERTTFINASVCTSSYAPTNKPIVIGI